MDEEKIKGICQVQCFIQRKSINIPSIIERAKRCVRILTTSLNYVNNELKESMHKALENNKDNPEFEIIMLTMDPESEVTNGRAEQLGRSLKSFRDELREALESMVEGFRKYSKNVDIRIYRTLPTQINYIIDDIVIIAVVSIGHKSRVGIHFVIQDQPPINSYFNTHFDLVRSRSEKVNF
jgi:hypothetical protein